MGQQDRFGREYYPALGPTWESRGLQPAENLYNEQQVPARKGAPLPLHQILREQARIPVKVFFMAAILDDGSERTFCTPNSIPPERVKEFYNAVNFNNIFTPTDTCVSTPSFEESSIPYRKSAFDLDSQEDYTSGRPARKRRNLGGEDMQIRPTTKKTTKPIAVSDSKQLWLFYEQRFKNCQQAACKLIAKAWIKTVEPKKQSTHPYTGKDEKAPDWWPQPWGEGTEHKVRHKEPDHLYKKERLHLLCHILRMIIEPNNGQHSDIKKLQLNIAKLEEVTWEALSAWFADSNQTGNLQKKPYLEEIFKVAKQEERFRAGMVDGSMKVHVTSDDRLAESYDDDTEESSPSRIDEGQDRLPISRSLTPHRGLAQSVPAYPNTHGSIDAADGSMHGAYMNDVVLRGPHYTQPLPGSEFDEGVARYNELSAAAPLHASNSMGLSDMQYMGPHDPGRRPSVADTHSGFATPATPSGYGTWAHTTAPSSATGYSMPGPGYQSNAPVHVGPPNAPMPQSQQYSLIYDGISRSHDMSHATMFRTLDPLPSAPGYPDYGHQGGRGLSGSSVKQEGPHKPMM
ncbi:hypothetical protein BKA67DRAFT_278713 [Truncatella angustata]|uniref:Subtelomeric hrmA-associated cluster protein AFUB-079030/YDR124W-like helical bundle domain-containing protein n=1 Tax=Truncatella angustata TaxID=152316 RepID=A0A9P8ULS9_9PEZI|nr:uncharacterized protein BKA67DRAFT_278713 [Truncatella angustata]KAH6654421.1 hypothetical protein BKA67DRAFT_278713 [Truncatella angustata]KAH8198677.1 hypothetical protein TruAng_007136 [Truncatella angustata]